MRDNHFDTADAIGRARAASGRGPHVTQLTRTCDLRELSEPSRGSDRHVDGEGESPSAITLGYVRP